MARPSIESIPLELRSLPQWVAWKAKPHPTGGKIGKLPVNPATGELASSSDPRTWSTLENALTSTERCGLNGIGFVFSASDEFVGVDLDHCRDSETGAITEEALLIIAQLSSYTEVSPSGTGVHVIVRGALPPGGRRKGAVEMYDSGRFFTVTGDRVPNTPAGIEKRTDELARLHAEVFGVRRDDDLGGGPKCTGEWSDDDDALIAKACAARNGARFSALWGGDHTAYSSPSEADLALCSHLAFWAGGDSHRIDRLFRRSGLMRPKWDERRGEETYGATTIRRALTGATEFYDPRGGRSGSKESTARSRESRSSKRRSSVPHYEPFPTHVLPELIARYIRTAALVIGCAEAFVALPLLAALASAIGNSRRIRLKKGWCEPAVIWAAIVGESGSLKSPAFDAALKSLRAIQDVLLKGYDTELRKYEEAKIVYEADLRDWQRKRKGDPPVRPIQPIQARIICSDTTIEAVAVLLKDAARGLLLGRDELSGWMGSFDAYTKGRGKDVALWLELHRAGPVIVDRKGAHSAIYVPRAAVSITGGVQPQVLASSLGREHFADGLAARFLLAMPPRQRKRWRETEMPDSLVEDLTDLFRNLYGLWSGGDDAVEEVPLSGSGKQTWVAFYEEHAAEQNSLTGDLAAAWAKIEGYAARLALVVHVVRSVSGDLPQDAPDAVDAGSMEAGVTLARWFAREAERVYVVLEETDEDREDRQLNEMIRLRGGKISVRELMHASRRYRGNAEDARKALQGLVDRHYGRWLTSAPGPKGGRPADVFALFDDHDDDRSAPTDDADVPGYEDPADAPDPTPDRGNTTGGNETPSGGGANGVLLPLPGEKNPGVSDDASSCSHIEEGKHLGNQPPETPFITTQEGFSAPSGARRSPGCDSEEGPSLTPDCSSDEGAAELTYPGNGNRTHLTPPCGGVVLPEPAESGPAEPSSGCVTGPAESRDGEFTQPIGDATARDRDVVWLSEFRPQRSRACRCCGQSRWWRLRRGGPWTCPRCHPPQPRPEQVEWCEGTPRA